MSHTIDSLVESWDGVGVVTRFDRPTGTWIFIAIHNDSLGPAAGGTRMKPYPTPADGLRDAMRLGRGMTYKWAGVGFDFGGGKAVLATPGKIEGEARAGLLRRYGRLLASLRGAFGTGPDLGTDADDMLVIGSETEFVHGVDVTTGMSIDPGPYTAHGVLAGIHASVHHVFGDRDLAGRSVHVQGVGDVGAPLARMLGKQGVRVLVSDVDESRAESLAADIGGDQVPLEGAYEVECDVYAPCAVGATLNDDTLPVLRCRIVSGSANNQLEDVSHAVALHDRGILYAPDYIVNAGGAIALATIGQGETDQQKIMDRVGGIEASLGEILREAADANESPVHAADRIVERRLAEAAKR